MSNIMTDARMSVQEIVHHFVPGQNPVALPARVNRRLASDEQAWVRRLTVGDQWQRLEAGWVERCSLLRVSNEEKPGGDDPRVVELGRGAAADAVEVEDAVPPGEFVSRLPPCLKVLWLRCRRGRAAVTVVAVPE